MVALVHSISHRIAKYLEIVGLVQRDMENSFRNLPVDDEDSLLHLQGSSVSYRIAMGPQQGQKVFMLQTLPASNAGEYGQVANFSTNLTHIANVQVNGCHMALIITKPVKYGENALYVVRVLVNVGAVAQFYCICRMCCLNGGIY